MYAGRPLLRIDITPFSSVTDPTRTLAFDAAGATLTDTTQNLVEAYDAAGRLVERRLRTGERVAAMMYVDATSDKLTAVIDAAGGVTAFAYDSAGRISTITDPAGRVTSFAVDANGDLLSTTDPTGSVEQFAYAAHHMTTKTSPRGDVTTYAYGSDGAVTTVTRAAGEATHIQAAFSAPPQRNAAGETIHVGTMTDTRGAVHTYTLDATANLSKEQVVADGVTVVYEWIRPAVLEPSTPGAAVETFRANAMGRVAYMSANGLATGLDNIWDPMGRLVARSPYHLHSNVPLSSYAYDANGFLSRVQEGPGSDAFAITRDAAGHAIRVEEQGAHPRKTDITWGAFGLPAAITDHGVTTTYVYDASGRVQMSADSVGRTTAFSYDAAGNVLSANDSTTTWNFGYDAVGRFTSATDALGNTTTYSYALAGCGCSDGDRVTSIHTPDLPSGSAWTFSYGIEGRLESVTDPDGHTESFTYEPAGDLQRALDALGRATTFNHDQLGRTTQVADALGRLRAKTYPVPSAAGWIGANLLGASGRSAAPTMGLTASLGDGDYQIGSNGYDALAPGVGTSELRSRGFPQVSLYRDATFALSFGQAWDPGGRLTRRDDRAGLPWASPDAFGGSGQTGQNDQMLLGYDAALPLSFVTSETAPRPGGFGGASFAYSNELDMIGASGWSSQAAPHEDMSFARDVAGRLTGVSRFFATVAGGLFAGPASAYAYAANGQVASITNVDGTHDYIYDARGLVQSIAIKRDGASEGTYSFAYDPLGHNTRLTYPDGHTRVQQYDHQGRLTSRCYEYGGSSSRCYTATYDAVGNPTSLADPEGTDVAEYDSLDRLVRVTRGGATEEYAYNALGALATNAGAALDARRPRIDGAGSADSAVPATYGGKAVALDAAGRITSLNGAALSWNARSKLTQVVAGGVTVQYGYDPFFRKISRSPSDGAAEYYIYEGADMVGVLDSTGVRKESYLYDGVDHPLRRHTTAGDTYYELDVAGNVRRLRAAGGADLGGYRYTAFGVPFPADASTPAPGAAATQPLGWKGRMRDPATGLVDMRARWWSAELGAFISVDEFVFHDAASTQWGWPGQNPYLFSDRSGHTGLFAWTSAGVEPPGPVRLGPEVVGVIGYDTQSSFYVAGISAVGANIGGESNYAGVYEGVEIEYSVNEGQHVDGISLREIGFGPEIPFLGGVGFVFGLYRQDSGSWGAYAGVHEGFVAEHAAIGLGASLPDGWYSHALDFLFSTRKPCEH